jgi:diguanylate cyclase
MLHMQPTDRHPMLPRLAPTRWLIGTPGGVPADLQPALVQGLYGSLAIFIGGVFNTILVSSVVAGRIPTAPFLIWAALEICLACVRLPLLIASHRAIKRGGRTYTDLYLSLAIAWAASVGYGTFISLTSGDWIVATLACLSAAAMAGGIAFRNFAAPRLVGVMILLSLGPCVGGAVLSGEAVLMVVAIQIPLYTYAMASAARQLNAMLVKTMRSERENGYLARHDPLTGLLNRAGLEEEIARRAAGDAESRRTTLFYVDLDGFKSVNDTLGHAAGDRLLAETGERLRSLVRPGDLVARIGGDEFVILTTHSDRSAALRAGERAAAALSDRPYLIGQTVAEVGASVGIAMLPDHGEDFAELFCAADRALYKAKSRGRARCSIAPVRQPAPATGKLGRWEDAPNFRSGPSRRAGDRATDLAA